MDPTIIASQITKKDFADPVRRSQILAHIQALRNELKAFSRFKPSIMYYRHQVVMQRRGREYFQQPGVKQKRVMATVGPTLERYEAKLEAALAVLEAKPKSKMAADRVNWCRQRIQDIKAKAIEKGLIPIPIPTPIPSPSSSSVEHFV